jgi:hypothetical protein
MAGTLEISDQLCWMPAGWVYDNTLERLASFLEHGDPALADLFLRSRTHENGGHCDIRMCDWHRLSKLIQAANDAYTTTQYDGTNSFSDPSAYQGFMDQFQELREMLLTRQRKLMQSD